MLDCACKNYYGHSNTAHYEQLTDNFCAVLVRVMMDDDDQLCRAVETLLCLYTKMAERCRYAVTVLYVLQILVDLPGLHPYRKSLN